MENWNKIEILNEWSKDEVVDFLAAPKARRAKIIDQLAIWNLNKVTAFFEPLQTPTYHVPPPDQIHLSRCTKSDL